MRTRELWLWLGAAFLTVGGVLTALAVGYYTARPDFSLGASPLMIGAYCALGLAFGSFLAAILGWRPWQRWLRFPRLEIRVMSGGFTMATKRIGPPDFPAQEVRLEVTRVHITNQETDRRASIRNAYLIAPSKDPRWPFCLFSAPDGPIRPVVPQSQTLRPLEFAIDLGPQETKSGDLIFEISEPETQFLANCAQPSAGARIELHDAVTGKMACFPANTMSTFSRGHGLRPTTLAERVHPMGTVQPKAPLPWHGLLGPADP